MIRRALLFSLILLVAPAWALAERLPAPQSLLSVETPRGTISFEVELAQTDEQRMRGLMFRKSMPRNAGMLFSFDDDTMISMWMKNTFIPLDMVFLNAVGTIVSIHEGAVPHSLAVISSKVPAKFVLELNAGVVDEVRLEVGQQMNHPWFDAAE